MRKEFSTIGVVSVMVSFGAAVVLCLQTPTLGLTLPWPDHALTQWGIEIGFFGLVVPLWYRPVSLRGWGSSLLALVGVRSAMSCASALALAGFHSGAAFSLSLQQMNGFTPRAAAMVFTLMVMYPLRTFLPDLLGRPKRKEAGEGSSEGMTEEDDSSWLLHSAASLRQPRFEGAPPASSTAVITMASPEQFRGTVDLPIRALLARVPATEIAPESERYDETKLVAVPLSLIVPQLKEAQVALSLEDLRQVLPPGVLRQAKSTGAEESSTRVLLPMEEVVPRLPLEVLELPAPTPPAWAELPDPESVVFATV